MAGGMQALRGLFPGHERQLIEAGSIILDAGIDVRSERPDYNPFPQRKTDVVTYCASRPLIEHCVHQSTRQQRNIAFIAGQRVVSLATTADGKAVTGVRSEAAGQGIHTVAADLVVDASGRGALTLDLLKSVGYWVPGETAIGMDMGYTSIRFAVPDDAPTDWKAVSTGATPLHSSRAAWLWPIEGRQWLLTLLGMRDEKPPGDWPGVQDFLRGLRTRTIHDAVSRAERMDGINRSALPSSVMRHFERLEAFPRRLLPIGDAICRFNPFFGQGITVAALEALHLQRLLRERVGESDPLADLAAPYFAGVQDLLTEPWSTALLDLVYPDTVGGHLSSCPIIGDSAA
jgi:2-polyprenyl-6-methoxyphenol hydroxylase-like FAD-dependent oxidoreductase